MTYRDHMAKAQLEYLQALMLRNGGKVAPAAIEAGLDRCSLYALLRRHKLKPERRWARPDAVDQWSAQA